MTPENRDNIEAQRAFLNRRTTEALLEQARSSREEFISRSFDALQVFAQIDAAAFKETETEIGENDDPMFEPYVLEDVIIAPMKDNVPQRTLSLLWVPDVALGQKGDEHMRIYFPVPDELDHLRESIPDKGYVFVEQKDKNGVILRTIVLPEGLYEYTSAADGGVQEIFDDMSDQMIRRRMSMRVDAGLPFIGQLMEDFANMHVAPQRFITDKNPRVTDWES